MGSDPSGQSLHAPIHAGAHVQGAAEEWWLPWHPWLVDKSACILAGANTV